MTHTASPDALYAFIRKEIAGENASEDRSGRTPLQALADHLSGLPLDSTEQQAYFAVAARLLDDIPVLSDIEVTRLIKFILTVRVLPPTVMAPAQRVLARLRSAASASKRADVLWLMQRLGARPLPKEIQQDAALRALRPWIWFDLALASKPSMAFDALPELAEHGGFLSAMLSRLLRIWRTAESEFPIFYSTLCEQLDETEKGELDEYLQAYGISIQSVDQNVVRFDQFTEKFSDRVPTFNSFNEPAAAQG